MKPELVLGRDLAPVDLDHLAALVEDRHDQRPAEVLVSARSAEVLRLLVQRAEPEQVRSVGFSSTPYRSTTRSRDTSRFSRSTSSSGIQNAFHSA